MLRRIRVSKRRTERWGEERDWGLGARDCRCGDCVVPLRASRKNFSTSLVTSAQSFVPGSWNALAETLHQQRLGAVEATALLRTVMEQIDVAVFAFDPTQHLRIANRTGERLMNRTVEQMLGLMDKLVESGKSLIVISHHQAVMAHADHLIDVGPGAGHEGGEVVFTGTPAELVAAKKWTLTGRHLA